MLKLSRDFVILPILFILLLLFYLRLFAFPFTYLINYNLNTFIIFLFTYVTLLFLEFFISYYLPKNFVFLRSISYLSTLLLSIGVTNILPVLGFIISPITFIIIFYILFLISQIGSYYIQNTKRMIEIIAPLFSIIVVLSSYIIFIL